MDIQVSTVLKLTIWLHMFQMTSAQGSLLHNFCSKGMTGQMKIRFEMVSIGTILSYNYQPSKHTVVSEQQILLPVNDLTV